MALVCIKTIACAKYNHSQWLLIIISAVHARLFIINSAIVIVIVRIINRTGVCSLKLIICHAEIK